MITNMYSIVKYVGDGANNSFSIPFQYIAQNDLKVYIDGVLTTAYTITGTNTLVTNQPIQKGSILTIKRETIRDRLVDFQDGSTIHGDSLNLDSIQMLYLVQEMVDIVESVPLLGEDDKFDMRGKVLKNVGEPVAPTDGASKGYLDTIKLYVDDALASIYAKTNTTVEAAASAAISSNKALIESDKAQQAAESAKTYAATAQNAINKYASSGIIDGGDF